MNNITSLQEKKSLFLINLYTKGINEVNLFLITTCWVYEKYELKILKCGSNTGILMQFNFKLCWTDKHLTSLRKSALSLKV